MSNNILAAIPKLTERKMAVQKYIAYPHNSSLANRYVAANNIKKSIKNHVKFTVTVRNWNDSGVIFTFSGQSVEAMVMVVFILNVT